MLLSTLLFLTLAAADIPRFQQFCLFQGHGECFAISNIEILQERIVVDGRNPISISNLHVAPIFLKGEVGQEYEFETEWGSGVLISMPDQESFIGEIPLQNEDVLHIYPCTDREECTSYGYELHEEPLPEVEGGEVDDVIPEENAVDSERLRALKPESAALISRVKSLPPTASKTQSVTSSTERVGSTNVRAMRRSLDSTAYDCEQISYNLGWWTMNAELCTLTVRMVFPSASSLGYPSYFSSYYHNFADQQAALIVGEFNEAMNSVHTSDKWYQLKLEHVDFTTWDQSKGAMEECLTYKNSHHDSDLIHCITHDSMGLYGAAYGPYYGDYYTGVSWAALCTLPSQAHSGRHSSVHEFGHNLGAPHVHNNAEGSTLMISGGMSGADNRLLKFSQGATVHESNPPTAINVAARIRQEFKHVANSH